MTETNEQLLVNVVRARRVLIARPDLIVQSKKLMTVYYESCAMSRPDVHRLVPNNSREELGLNTDLEYSILTCL